MKLTAKTFQTMTFAVLLGFSACLSSLVYRALNPATISFRNGESLWAHGRTDDALKAFRQAAHAGDLRPGMALKLASAAFAAGDEATGQAVLSRLVRSNAALTPDTLNAVAGAFDQHGMPLKALDALDRAGDAILRSEPAATYLAELKARAGDTAGAQRLYRDVLTKYPNTVAPSLGLAQLLAWNGNTREAEALCRSVLTRNPDNRQVRIALGRVLTAAGRFEEAIAEYRKALEKTS